MASASEERESGSVVSVSREICNLKLKGSYELKIHDFLKWCEFRDIYYFSSYVLFKLEFPG